MPSVRCSPGKAPLAASRQQFENSRTRADTSPRLPTMCFLEQSGKAPCNRPGAPPRVNMPRPGACIPRAGAPGYPRSPPVQPISTRDAIQGGMGRGGGRDARIRVPQPGKEAAECSRSQPRAVLWMAGARDIVMPPPAGTARGGTMAVCEGFPEGGLVPGWRLWHVDHADDLFCAILGGSIFFRGAGEGAIPTEGVAAGPRLPLRSSLPPVFPLPSILGNASTSRRVCHRDRDGYSLSSQPVPRSPSPTHPSLSRSAAGGGLEGPVALAACDRATTGEGVLEGLSDGRGDHLTTLSGFALWSGGRLSASRSSTNGARESC